MKDKALQHAVAWSIQNIFNANKDVLEILNNKDLEEKEKIVALHEQNGAHYRLINLMLLFKPLREAAQEEFPEQKSFFEWFDEKWKMITDNNMIQGACGCKGCKEESGNNES